MRLAHRTSFFPVDGGGGPGMARRATFFLVGGGGGLGMAGWIDLL